VEGSRQASSFRGEVWVWGSDHHPGSRLGFRSRVRGWSYGFGSSGSDLQDSGGFLSRGLGSPRGGAADGGQTGERRARVASWSGFGVDPGGRIPGGHFGQIRSKMPRGGGREGGRVGGGVRQEGRQEGRGKGRKEGMVGTDKRHQTKMRRAAR